MSFFMFQVSQMEKEICYFFASSIFMRSSFKYQFYSKSRCKNRNHDFTCGICTSRALVGCDSGSALLYRKTVNPMARSGTKLHPKNDAVPAKVDKPTGIFATFGRCRQRHPEPAIWSITFFCNLMTVRMICIFQDLFTFVWKYCTLEDFLPYFYSEKFLNIQNNFSTTKTFSNRQMYFSLRQLIDFHNS